jgi:hypothetical protein
MVFTMRFRKVTVTILAASALLFMQASLVQAGIFLSLVTTSNSIDLSTNPLQQFAVSVRAQADSGTQDLFAYTIPVDLLNPIGTDPPPGWTVLSVTRSSTFGGDFFTPSLNPLEGDVSMSETRLATPVTFTTAPLTLFQFTVEVSRASAVNGSYFASIVSNGTLFALNNTSVGGTLPSNQFSTGTVSIQIVGVPEPSSLALIGFALVTGLGILGRRSQHGQKTVGW